jgi:hypothetical protein
MDYGIQNKMKMSVQYLGNIDSKAYALQIPIGLIKTHQPLRITLEDTGAKSGVGHEFTCLARKVPRAETQQSDYSPECFYHGSAGVDDTYAARFRFFFMLPQFTPFSMCNRKIGDGQMPEVNKDYASCHTDRSTPWQSDAKSGLYYPSEGVQLDEIMLYLAVDDYVQEDWQKGQPMVHTLTADISSTYPIQWCLEGQSAKDTNPKAVCPFDSANAKQFWYKATSGSVLGDYCVFPRVTPPAGTTPKICADKGKPNFGGEIPTISVEGVVRRITDGPTWKASECFGRTPPAFYDPGKNECVKA